jgi:hypothetical protein
MFVRDFGKVLKIVRISNEGDISPLIMGKVRYLQIVIAHRVAEVDQHSRSAAFGLGVSASLRQPISEPLQHACTLFDI